MKNLFNHASSSWVRYDRYEWKKDNGQFIPYPTSWLNQKRWEDETILKKTEIKTNKQTNFNNYEQRQYDNLDNLYANKGG